MDRECAYSSVKLLVFRESASLSYPTTLAMLKLSSSLSQWKKHWMLKVLTPKNKNSHSLMIASASNAIIVSGETIVPIL